MVACVQPPLTSPSDFFEVRGGCTQATHMEAVWLNIQNWFNTRLTADLNLVVNQRIKAVKRGSTTDVKKGSALVHKYNNMPIKKCVR